MDRDFVEIEGRAYYSVETSTWYIEIQRLEGPPVRYSLGPWPHPDLYTGRDENRKIVALLGPTGSGKAQLLRFL